MNLFLQAPQEGASIQVIGAGLPGTGTAALSLALHILLSGPVYHGGSQIAFPPCSTIKKWTRILSHTPMQNNVDKTYVLDNLRETLVGYVACTDSPGAQFTQELLELYPNAKVIYTIRDPVEWLESAQAVALGPAGFWGWAISPLPTLRYLAPYLAAFRKGRWGELYDPLGTFDPEHVRPEQWDLHMAYLKRVVPKEQLFYVDVRTGWEPLCEILQCKKPEGQPFPWIDDMESAITQVETHLRDGLMVWAGMYISTAAVVAFGLGLGLGAKLWRRK